MCSNYLTYKTLCVEIKCQLDATEVFIADLIACSACFGSPLCPSSGAREYYTVVAACGIWLDATEVFIADLIACSTCFGSPLCPSSGAREYYTVVAACGISCCGFFK